MSIREYWAAVWVEARKSWTIWVATFWVVLGVVETQMHLLQPLIGEKYFGVASIVVSATLALARMRGINARVKAGK